MLETVLSALPEAIGYSSKAFHLVGLPPVFGCDRVLLPKEGGGAFLSLSEVELVLRHNAEAFLQL